MRSSSGPLSRRRVAGEVALAAAAARATAAYPHGHGFVAATSMKRVGKIARALAADDRRRGRPRAAGAAPRAPARGNSASSSRNRTPWWARLASPGARRRRRRRRGPDAEIVWCGARNGRSADQAGARRQPRDAVDARDLERLRRASAAAGSTAAAGRASSCPCPGGPREQQVVAARRGDRQRRERRRRGRGRRRGRARRRGPARAPRAPRRGGGAAPSPPRRIAATSRSVPRAGDVEPVDERRLRARARAGTTSPSSPARARALGHRERAAAGPQLAAERELAEDRAGARARSAGTWPLAARIAAGDREVEARPGLAQVRRREVDGDAPRGNSKPELRIAAWTRSRASRTARSPSPTMVKPAGRRARRPRRVTGRGSRPSMREGGDTGEHGRPR